MISKIIEYMLGDSERYLLLIQQHLIIDAVALAICIVIALPFGYICAKSEKISMPVIAVANIIMVFPSLALFALLQPIIGIGMTPAVIALVFLGIPTLILNTRSGYKNVDRTVIENAYAMGMEPWRICLTVETPLALPSILNGMRITTVSLIAGTTIAAYVGAGGLGFYIKLGLTANQPEVMYLGALTVAGLAIIVDCTLAYCQRRQLRKIA